MQYYNLGIFLDNVESLSFFEFK